MSDGHPVLERAGIDPAVLTLRPDYRALLIVAEDLRPGPSDEVSDRLLKGIASGRLKWYVTDFPSAALLFMTCRRGRWRRLHRLGLSGMACLSSTSCTARPIWR